MNSRSMTAIKLACAGLLALCGLVVCLLHLPLQISYLFATALASLLVACLITFVTYYEDNLGKCHAMQLGTNLIWLFAMLGLFAALLVCGLLLHSRETWFYLAMIGAWMAPLIAISWPRKIIRGSQRSPDPDDRQQQWDIYGQ